MIGQCKNFFRVLVFGAPSPESSPSADRSLARTAGDLKIVNMSVEDDRLGSADRNQAYQRSLD